MPEQSLTQSRRKQGLVSSFSMVIMGLLVIISVLLITACTWLWVQSEQQQQRISHLNANNIERISWLKQKVKQQGQQLDSLQQQVNQQSAPSIVQYDQQQLSQIGFQLHLAQQYLTAGVANMPQALQWLQLSQKQLTSLKKADVGNLQQAMSKLSQQLQQLQHIDPSTISQQLMQLGQDITQLLALPAPSTKTKPTVNKISKDRVTTPASTGSTLAATSAKADANSNTVIANADTGIDTDSDATTTSTSNTSASQQAPSRWYHDFWKSTLNTVSEAITIRHRQQPVLPLSKQQRQIISSQLKLALLQAQWALLQQNQALYLSSLEQCQHLLSQNFPPQALRSRLLNTLERLQRVNLQPTLPSFAPVFSALTHSITALSSQRTSLNTRTPPHTSIMTPTRSTQGSVQSLPSISKQLKLQSQPIQQTDVHNASKTNKKDHTSATAPDKPKPPVNPAVEI